MDMEEFITLIGVIAVVGVIIYIGMIAGGIYKGKSVAEGLKSDDEKPQFIEKGKVLEKIVDSQHVQGGAYEFDITIEWIVIESANGTRRKVRNIKPKEILIATGDRGEFSLRGETIYGFKRTMD